MLPSEVDHYRVTDTDTHVIEPYDLWTSRVSTVKWGDKVPHVRWDESRQADLWFSGDDLLGPAASAAQAGWKDAPPQHPPRLGDVDPVVWRNVDRLKLVGKLPAALGVEIPVNSEPRTGLSMGEHQAITAKQMGIKRLDQRWAHRDHAVVV